MSSKKTVKTALLSASALATAKTEANESHHAVVPANSIARSLGKDAVITLMQAKADEALGQATITAALLEAHKTITFPDTVAGAPFSIAEYYKYSGSVKEQRKVKRGQRAEIMVSVLGCELHPVGDRAKEGEVILPEMPGMTDLKSREVTAPIKAYVDKASEAAAYIIAFDVTAEKKRPKDCKVLPTHTLLTAAEHAKFGPTLKSRTKPGCLGILAACAFNLYKDGKLDPSIADAAALLEQNPLDMWERYVYVGGSLIRKADCNAISFATLHRTAVKVLNITRATRETSTTTVGTGPQMQAVSDLAKANGVGPLMQAVEVATATGTTSALKALETGLVQIADQHPEEVINALYKAMVRLTKTDGEASIASKEQAATILPLLATLADKTTETYAIVCQKFNLRVNEKGVAVVAEKAAA